jgi:hypothetical protein
VSVYATGKVACATLPEIRLLPNGLIPTEELKHGVSCNPPAPFRVKAKKGRVTAMGTVTRAAAAAAVLLDVEAEREGEESTSSLVHDLSLQRTDRHPHLSNTSDTDEDGDESDSDPVLQQILGLDNDPDEQ